MKKQLWLFAILILGFPAIFGLSRFLEANKPELPAEVLEQDLAFSGATLKKASLGFEGLLADYYWMNALQYVGRKVIESKENIQLDNLRPLNPRLLYPYIDAATTLDPEFSAVYAYGSAVLPAVDSEQAIKISEKGVNVQPENWRMYHNLGFIHWQLGDYKKAAEIYESGSAKQGAPVWMLEMSARLRAEGGSRTTAREIYLQIYNSAEEEQTRELAVKRLQQLESLDERDAIRAALADFQNKANRCPNNWREALPVLKNIKFAGGVTLRFAADNSPVDPSGAAYLLIQKEGKCEVDLDQKNSKIPTK
ncbi:MAG: tetratricopeptide repeat protein [Acidobacteriota bacterium]|nr:tetratricopeptide repeat protein [Acidobacteriota bacterium]